jgi:hypothetical protein
MRPDRYREPMARWKLALLVAFTLFFLGFVLSRSPAIGLILLVLSWMGLGLSALRWGYDSRDGRDWDDRPQRRPRSPEVRLPRTAEEGGPGGVARPETPKRGAGRRAVPPD